ncbi:MAG: ferrous iron transport protein A, partial [Chloroflexota bacterium]|nr:ferrous iron transport protein A [Chloroflexota bacterium]
IPRHDGTVPGGGEVRLLDLPPGTTATVGRVPDRAAGLLRHVADLGLRPGCQVTLVEVRPFEGPVRLRVDGQDVVIGRPLAGVIHVHPDDPGHELADGTPTPGRDPDRGAGGDPGNQSGEAHPLEPPPGEGRSR